jgi:hypothetical protein
MTNNTSSPLAYLRPRLSEDAFHGLVGDVARSVSQKTGGDPAAALLFFLTMIGNAVGPQPHVWFGGAEQAARIFAVIVGDSASRKDTVLAAVEDLFSRADPDWYSSRIEYGLQSPEAMIELVADGSGDCRMLILESEYQRFVSRMTRSGNFGPIMRNAYDGRTLQISRSRGGRSNNNRSVRSSTPHISMCALITPEELSRIYPVLRAAGGLETRVLYVLSAQQADTNPFAMVRGEDPTLVERLRHAIESSRARVLEQSDPISRELCLLRGVQPPFAIPLAPTLRNRWEDIVNRLPQVKPDFRHLASRGPTHVIRLAHAYAIADASPALSVEHIDAALALWTFCARSMERIFGVPTGSLEPQVDPKRVGRLFEFVARQGDWVNREQITNLFHRNVTKTDLDAIIDSLLDDGLIERRVIQTSGRPRTEYHACGSDSDTFFVSSYPDQSRRSLQ